MSKEKEQPQNEENLVDLLHVELLEDEKINAQDLPVEIQASIAEFDGLLADYENEQTEEKYNKILELDAQIADSIQTWLENDSLEDDDAEEEEEDGDTATPVQPIEPIVEDIKPVVEPAPAPVVEVVPTIVEEVVPVVEVVEEVKPVENEMLTAIKAKLVNGEISETDLGIIVGAKNGIADDTEYKFDGLILRKVYLHPKYRVQK